VNLPLEVEAPYGPSMNNFVVLIPIGLGCGATVEWTNTTRR